MYVLTFHPYQRKTILQIWQTTDNIIRINKEAYFAKQMRKHIPYPNNNSMSFHIIHT